MCQIPLLTMSSHRTLSIKKFLAKTQKQNHPRPEWIWIKTGNKISSKRSRWRRTKLRL
ncbi:large ribosomal subunit protein eL39-like [Ochotona princeps]|uniref:large ribosomal subunit protein eL39-like n=1 Tax=Ochotona princeps TaxID=9978 RepID=UPI0027148958|nr:large ribosomal subunit protein eL39-like [Ochotona princeps]